MERLRIVAFTNWKKTEPLYRAGVGLREGVGEALGWAF